MRAASRLVVRAARSAVGAALITCLALASARAAEDMVTLNFANTDIEAVAGVLGQMLQRNFIIDPRVKGTVNVVSARPVPVSVAYEIFLSALRLQGFTAVEGGGVTKILPEAEAKLHLRTLAPGAAASGDRLVTQVYVLRHESAAQLLPVLRPLISPNNTITVYPNNNSLVVTDYADNLRRLDRIIESIDRPAGGEPVVMPLRYAAAVDVAQTVTRILADGPVGAAGQQAASAEQRSRVVVAPDSRTNSVIVRAEDPARLARVQAMVLQLDAPTPSAGNIHVVYLKNGDAVRIAQTLRAILSGEAGSGAGAPTAPTPGSPVPPAPSASAAGFVQADAASNAVIIAAPEPVVASLRAVIEKLDIRRAQVFVEALIVEVTAEKAAEFGIQWQAINTPGGTQAIAGTNFGTRGAGTNILDVAANPTSVAPGLNIGIVRGQITLPGIGTITNLAALARALETDSKANILSTPNLLTLANEEARIVVGQNVPFITGQYAQTGSSTTATPFQTIERRDVGLTLRIRPQISEGGAVKLQIYQEVSNVQDSTNAAGVITNKRSIDSTVIVDDGEIVALGGLVQDSTGATNNKVPVLGDIPLLGALFRYETRRQTKTNLMVFLRPVVVRDGAASGAIAATRYRQMRDEEERAKLPPHSVLPDIEGPRLPPASFPAPR